jgi:hypothetical protein
VHRIRWHRPITSRTGAPGPQLLTTRAYRGEIARMGTTTSGGPPRVSGLLDHETQIRPCAHKNHSISGKCSETANLHDRNGAARNTRHARSHQFVSGTGQIHHHGWASSSRRGRNQPRRDNTPHYANPEPSTVQNTSAKHANARASAPHEPGQYHQTAVHKNHAAASSNPHQRPLMHPSFKLSIAVAPCSITDRILFTVDSLGDRRVAVADQSGDVFERDARGRVRVERGTNCRG